MKSLTERKEELEEEYYRLSGDKKYFIDDSPDREPGEQDKPKAWINKRD